jgi:hypothetical protein
VAIGTSSLNIKQQQISLLAKTIVEKKNLRLLLTLNFQI